MEFQQLLALASRKQSKHDELIKKIDEQKRLKQEEERQRLEITKKLYSKKVTSDVSQKPTPAVPGVHNKHQSSKSNRGEELKIDGVTANDPSAVSSRTKSHVKSNGSTDSVIVKEKSPKEAQSKDFKKDSTFKKPVERRKELSFNEILELAKKNVPENIGEKRPFEDLIPCPINSKYRKADKSPASTGSKHEKESRKLEPPLNSEIKHPNSTLKTTTKLEKLLTPNQSKMTKGIIEKAVSNIEKGALRNSDCNRAKVLPNIHQKSIKEPSITPKYQSNSHEVPKDQRVIEKKTGILAQLCDKSSSMLHMRNEASKKPAQFPHKLSSDQKLRDRSQLNSSHSSKNQTPVSNGGGLSIQRKPLVSSKPSNDQKPSQKKNAILAQLNSGQKIQGYSESPKPTISNKKLSPAPISSTHKFSRPASNNKEDRIVRSEPKVTYSNKPLPARAPPYEPKDALPAPPTRGIAAQLGIISAGRVPQADNYDSYSSEGDYESDDSFIDDSEAPRGKEYAHVVRDIHRALNFDPRKYKEVNPYDDLRSMEANYREIEKEERRSARLGALEDNEELVRDMLRKKKKMIAKQHKSL